jgi:hypothetical protein
LHYTIYSNVVSLLSYSMSAQKEIIRLIGASRTRVPPL